MFGRTIITLGIDPHSSFSYFEKGMVEYPRSKMWDTRTLAPLNLHVRYCTVHGIRRSRNCGGFECANGCVRSPRGSSLWPQRSVCRVAVTERSLTAVYDHVARTGVVSGSRTCQPIGLINRPNRPSLREFTASR